MPVVRHNESGGLGTETRVPLRGITKWRRLAPILKGIAEAAGFQLSFEGMDGQEIPGGMHLKAKGGSGDAAACPFNWKTKSGDSGVLLYQASPLGTINGWLPNNTFTAGVSTEFSLPAGVTFLKLSCTATDATLTGAVYVCDATPPVPIDVSVGVPPAAFEVLLFVVFVDGGGVKLFRTIDCANLLAKPAQTLVTSRDASEIECGTDPYLRHYTWDIVAAQET